MDKTIYLDYQATTPCDPQVVAEMLPYFIEKFGNPHSRNHAYGWDAETAVEHARAQIAATIGAHPKEVIFTSGATESNNLALKGVMDFYKDKKNHLITVATEHKCILDTCRYLQKQGYQVTYLKVQQNGLIDLRELESAITDKTCLISVMAVNNEIGVIQPLKEIGEICRRYGVYFHTDAAQALGKIPLDVEDMNIDLLSLSSHKIYGPKGIGALYVRRNPRIRLSPLITGGGQERGMRAGTLPTPLCVGFGKAAELAESLRMSENERLTELRDYFYKKINDELPEVYLNGDLSQRIPGNLNLSFAHVEGEGLMMGVKNLCLSSGSACTSSSLEPSYVLKAIGVGETLAHTSLRIGFGRYTTQDEVSESADQIIQAVRRLRDMSPLWEMSQAGIDIDAIQWAEH